MKGQDWRAWCGRLWLSLPLLLGALWFSGASHASWDQDLYRQLGLAGKLDKQVFRQALDGYQKVRHKRKPILTIIDYSKPSTMRRLFVIKNSNARKRAIVVHGADYASPKHLRKFDKLGRSWGCPALPREQSRAIIDTIKGGSVIYAHG